MTYFALELRLCSPGDTTYIGSRGAKRRAPLKLNRLAVFRPVRKALKTGEIVEPVRIAASDRNNPDVAFLGKVAIRFERDPFAVGRVGWLLIFSAAEG